MRATGITSYYNRVQPARPASRLRQVERDEPKGIRELPMTVDVTSPEVKRQEKEDAIFRAKSLTGQAILCLAIILLMANIINQGLKWLCG